MNISSYFFILCLFLVRSPCLTAAPTIQNGVLDLRALNWADTEVVSLEGPWEFYWGTILEPESYQEKPQHYLSPNQEWHKTSVPGLDLQRIGQATYALHILSEETRSLTLKVPVLNSASRIWFNGELKQDFGVLASSAAAEKVRVGVSYLTVELKVGHNLLLMAISNHSFWYGGSNVALQLGESQILQSERELKLRNDAMSIGFIIFMSLYHLLIWALMPGTRTPLWLGLFSLTLTMRMVVVGDGQILATLVPDFAAEHRHFFEYLGTALPGAFLLLFMQSIFPRECAPRFYTPPIVICFLWSFCILALPPRWYPFFLEAFQLVILYFGVICVWSNCLAVKHRKEGSWILLFGIITIFVATTNDIFYSKRVIQTGHFLHLGLMALLFSQAAIFARSFVMAFKRAEAAEVTVKQLNIGLEQRIEQRTEEIDTILNHVQAGFVLLDRSGLVRQGFTRSCVKILGQPIREGQSFSDFLSVSSQMKQQFRLALQQIFQGDLPLDIALSQLPTRFPVGERMISLEAAAVQHKDTTETVSILLTLADISRLVEAEDKLKHSAALIHILEDQAAFRLFLQDFSRDIKVAREELTAAHQTHVRSIIHTVKGNAATFQLQSMVELIHYIEDKADITTADIEGIEQWMQRFLAEFGSIISIDPDHLEVASYTIDDQDLEVLRRNISRDAPQFIKVFHSWTQHIQSLPIKSYISPLKNMVERTAEPLGKKVRLLYKAEVPRIHMQYMPVLATLNHVIRNAVIHGIERPELRGSKPSMGTIKMNLYFDVAHRLCIDINDDGCGIDPKAIRRKALKLNLVRDDNPVSDEDLIQLVFHPDFSTHDAVDEHAGRGMGLAAVAKAVQDCGGTCDVRSTLGQGTTFRIVLPEGIQLLPMTQAG